VSDAPSLRTPLHALHLELGARMVPFAGYDMPLQYAAGLREEHLWTRASAGLFDVSHMGQLRVRGPDLHAALERVLPLDFAGWPAGTQKYALLLNERGGIEDDLMVAHLGHEVSIVANASRKQHDLAALKDACKNLQFRVLDAALLALQGPRAQEALPEAAALSFMQVKTLKLDGVECLVTRSGYTGEDGFEISVPVTQAVKLARRLLAHPAVKPVGLGARDTLRLEAGLPLYGQDMDAETTPREAQLAWSIARARRAGGAKAGGFPGAASIERAERRLVGLVGVEAVPVRSGAELVDDAGKVVGKVTSGTVSPTLGRPIMMGYLRTDHPEHAELQAVVRGKPHPVKRTDLPFVPKRYKR
jgi:aminomethyltransferase